MKYIARIDRQSSQNWWKEPIKTIMGNLSPCRSDWLFIKYITGGMSSPLSDAEIDRFVRQLPRMLNQTILYPEFLDLITKVGNQNHNPFKSLVRKICDFLTSNKMSAEEHLLRIDPLYGSKEGVTY